MEAPSVRDLIVELADVEDAIRDVGRPARASAAHAAGGLELTGLLLRERRIVRELRRRRGQWRRATRFGGPGR